jgi:hypothetical protein
MIMASYYRITLRGHLDGRWSAWFENMAIANQPNGEAILSGPLADQAALHGVLIKIRDLGLPLLAVATVAPDEAQQDAREASERG